MLGPLCMLVDDRTEYKLAGGAVGKPIKDVMHCYSGALDPQARFAGFATAEQSALVPPSSSIRTMTTGCSSPCTGAKTTNPEAT